MAVCGLLALVLGYLAGLRFRVMVVVPLELAAGALAVGLSFVGLIGAAQAGLDFLAFSVALQVGYTLALACPLPVRSLTPRWPAKA